MSDYKQTAISEWHDCPKHDHGYDHWCHLCEIERLEAVVKLQKKYLDNKDSVIKGMNKMIDELEVKYEYAIDAWNKEIDRNSEQALGGDDE